MDAIVWHDKPRDGVLNMAIDEAMAQVASSKNCAILRVYYWEQPFLSLGYFQSASDRLVDPLIADLPYTRRLSGGGAIIHDREITYSLAIADQSGSKSPASTIYTQVHAAISESLREFGFNAQTAAELNSGAESEGTREPFLCFQRRADADLIVDGYKIVGSAQRRIAGALLQHGSILLSASKHTPGLLGLKELRSETACEHQELEVVLSKCLIEHLKPALEFCIAIDSWTLWDGSTSDSLSTVSEEMRRLANQKYNSLSWKDKR